MTLDTGGQVDFKPRPIAGAPAAAKQVTPQSLLLDGQQRMTSLYQVTLRRQVVETMTAKNKKVKRWFYLDIRKALEPAADREDAIIGVPEDRIIRTDFGRAEVLDLSTPEKEYASLMYPVSRVFDHDKWQDGFDKYWHGDEKENAREEFRSFKHQILENFKYYRLPVIALDRSTTKEAVCVVFEKVNTGGKPLDAFELVTAMYAAAGHELRKDWYGDDTTKGRHHGFVQAAKFLHMLHIYRIFDLPYQSQIIPLAAILADIGDAWEHEANRAKLVRWYWNGVFGELYGSAVDSRIARDFIEVPVWLGGGAAPSTVSETLFRADRLKTMRMRLSAAYKGVNALINKSPLSYKTNRIIGGVAPSEYLARLESGDKATPPISREALDRVCLRCDLRTQWRPGI